MKKPVQGTRFVFDQEPDSCAPVDAPQMLEVLIDDAGGGPYLVFKTERWALDPEDIGPFIRRLRWCLRQCGEAGDDRED